MDIDNNKIIFRILFFVASLVSAIFLPWYVSILFLIALIAIYTGAEAMFVAAFLDVIYSQGSFIKVHIFVIFSFILLLVVFQIKKSLRLSK